MSDAIKNLLGVELPIIQAPMAGFISVDLIVAVAKSGGLGSLPCAMLSPLQVRDQVGAIRERTAMPINLNYFCHQPPPPDADVDRKWRRRLEPHYREMGIDPPEADTTPMRGPFDEADCETIELLKPELVSFHFGLPTSELLERVKATGARILSSATTVREAIWLEDNGCDAVIAQGLEAGGHRGMFLEQDMSSQVGTFSLVPQVVDAIRLPVIAAGGIGDARGVAAALALGASAVQVGTAYLFCAEALVPELHRKALRAAATRTTAVTNVFTGRPARSLVGRLVTELGVMAAAVPPFPTAAGFLAPLRALLEDRGSDAFSPLWAGQSASLGRYVSASELTKLLAVGARRQRVNPTIRATESRLF